ncbi:DUF938 domain-containing protein [Ruegeria sp. EL01]|jgi:SAM-dependent methyltransferase|uniref:DUF938 domain-containing protein n=1 Tax=Ruegeria sp. EL01 TaxID=2107578 RepID=UPI001576F791|nr:DUF938 domain-containing protein [Ruegeria sp. EL01]
MIKRNLPPSASVATAADDGKMVAPAATRNTDALCELVSAHAPQRGKALEIASGTGQHICAFAKHLPDLTWQPTEIDPDRRASIDAYASVLPNVAAAADLNATSAGWHSRVSQKDLIILVNLLHLVSWQETKTLVTEVAKALTPGGRFILYGPFQRAGQLTSDGDKRFHNALIQQDPEIGYKNDDDIAELFLACSLELLEIVEMPANNLAFIAKKPA